MGSSCSNPQSMPAEANTAAGQAAANGQQHQPISSKRNKKKQLSAARRSSSSEEHEECNPCLEQDFSHFTSIAVAIPPSPTPPPLSGGGCMVKPQCGSSCVDGAADYTPHSTCTPQSAQNPPHPPLLIVSEQDVLSFHLAGEEDLKEPRSNNTPQKESSANVAPPPPPPPLHHATPCAPISPRSHTMTGSSCNRVVKPSPRGRLPSSASRFTMTPSNESVGTMPNTSITSNDVTNGSIASGFKSLYMLAHPPQPTPDTLLGFSNQQASLQSNSSFGFITSLTHHPAPPHSSPSNSTKARHEGRDKNPLSCEEDGEKNRASLTSAEFASFDDSVDDDDVWRELDFND